jgi:hypothetical protein
VLVLGLLGGSAELARCPQLVSFSGAVSPASVEARSSEAGIGRGAGPGYVPAAFHASGNAAGAPHETLLKASMPVTRGVHPTAPVSTANVKHHRAAARISLPQGSRQDRAGVQQVRRWLVLTSWDRSEDGPERPGMVLAGSQERVISISYAAVPTAGGWLVIQL